MNPRATRQLWQLNVASNLLILVIAIALAIGGGVLYIAPLPAQSSISDRVTRAETKIEGANVQFSFLADQVNRLTVANSELNKRLNDSEQSISKVYGGVWAIGGIMTLLQLVSMTLGGRLKRPTSEKND